MKILWEISVLKLALSFKDSFSDSTVQTYQLVAMSRIAQYHENPLAI
jgi:hypothetical protein